MFVVNTEVMFSSKNDSWETPQEFFDKLNEEFGFEIDVCASSENAKCEIFFTKEQDALAQQWEGICWCNPHMEEKLENGWKKHTYLANRAIVLS